MTLRVFLVQSPLDVHTNCSLTITFAGFNSPVSVLNCHSVEPGLYFIEPILVLLLHLLYKLGLVFIWKQARFKYVTVHVLDKCILF